MNLRSTATGWGLAIIIVMAGARAEAAPTYSKDVAPILNQHCVRCHRPGEVAPMSFTSYAETRPWAKGIRKAVAARIMPPWGANPAHGKFSNDASLSAEETKTINDWAEGGAEEGNPADLPAPPKFPEGWTLGEPDYIVELGEFRVPPDGEDLFPSVTVNLNMEQDQWIRAIEFRPGDKRVVHHILALMGNFSMGSGEMSQQSVADAFKRGASSETPEIFQVWVAGAQPTVYPEGMGRVMKKNQAITVNLHYHPMGQPANDKSRIGLYFGKGELKKRITTNFAVNTGFLIPPFDPAHKVQAFHVFDQDSKIVSFMPHMHVRGKDIRYDIIYPDGRRETALDVPRYDYNWQLIYYPAQPISVPKGTRVEAIGHYDNSKENEHNPDPSRAIPYRDATVEEMFVAFMEFIVDEGVAPAPPPSGQKIAELLSAHPAAERFQANVLFQSFGLHIPPQGEGMMYLVTGSVMFTSTLRDVAWKDGPAGKEFRAATSFPTPTGGGVSANVSGSLAPTGEFNGKIDLGVEEAAADPQRAKVLSIPFKGRQGPAQVSMAR